MNVAARVKYFRKKKGISQYRLSQESGISQSFLSALEAGAKWPTVYTLEKICACLGVSLAEFFTDAPLPIPEHLRLLLEEARYLNPEQCEKLIGFINSLRTEDS